MSVAVAGAICLFLLFLFFLFIVGAADWYWIKVAASITVVLTVLAGIGEAIG